jgi:hypothetical protein
MMPGHQHALLLPILAQILLTIAMYLKLAIAKSRALREGKVDLERRALHDDAWPDAVLRINNNIRNQFEVPMLFYVLTLVLWELRAGGTLALALAWAFVISRVLHAWIHTGSNYVPLRRRVFMAGVAAIVAMAVLVMRVAFFG